MTKHRKLTPEQTREAEANYFAMCLLMPEEMVHAEMKKLTPEQHDIDKLYHLLSERFQVSQMIVATRLTELGYDFG